MDQTSQPGPETVYARQSMAADGAMKAPRTDLGPGALSWVRVPAPEKEFDVRTGFAEVPSSKPAEPLCPFGDMTLNSGGFFLPGSQSANRRRPV